MYKDIPKNWEKHKLKEYIDIIRGVNYKSNEAFDTKVKGTTGILRSNNISNDATLNFEKIVFVNNKHIKNEQKIKKYDILIAMSSGSKELVGKSAQAEEDYDYAFGAFCGIVRPKNINRKLIGYFFQTDYYRNKISELSTGININNLRKEYIENLDILVPVNPNEQEEIVQVLDTASDIIRLRKKCIENAQSLIPALFQEMFGDIKNNTKNWKSCNLNDLVYIDRKNISVNELKSNAYRYIGLEHIEKGTGKILIDLENNFNVDLKSNKYYFTNEHVLYGKLRPYLNKVALPTCDGVCSTDIFPIMPRKNISNKYFIKYLMSSPYFVQITSLKTSGANLPRIGTKALELIKVICPDIELQNQFAAKVQEIEEYIKSQQAELENAKTMFQSLLHHAFTGELTRHKFGGEANG